MVAVPTDSPNMLPWLELALPGGTLETWARVAARSGKRMTIPAGSVIQRSGHRMRKLLYIHSGEVRLASTYGGKRQWMLVLTGGHLLNDEACFNRRPVLDEAVVTQSAHVTSFTEDQVRHLIQTCPELTVEMMLSLTAKIDVKLRQVSSLTFYNARERIHALVDFLAQAGLPICSSDLTHQDVADIVGCVRVTASKVLGELDR